MTHKRIPGFRTPSKRFPGFANLQERIPGFASARFVPKPGNRFGSLPQAGEPLPLSRQIPLFCIGSNRGSASQTSETGDPLRPKPGNRFGQTGDPLRKLLKPGNRFANF